MKGFRTLVLQDLPYVLPSKGFQNRLVSNYQSPSSQLHTSPSSGRFWNFFEFTVKEEPCRDVKKCPSSKDLVSSTLASSNELDGGSKPASTTMTSTVALNSNLYGYQLDLRSTPMNWLKIQKPLNQENLMSLLDGNPVPKTLKWKLKGYKTLRNEQAGDFAFVPGGKSYDLDVLSRNEFDELVPLSNYQNKVRGKQKTVSSKTEDSGSLLLTPKVIENPEETGRAKDLEGCKQISLHNPNNKGESRTNQEISATPTLGTISAVKMEDVKFLPISKSEIPTSQMKDRTQPSARYSSEPPKKIPKPSAPVFKQSEEKSQVVDATKEAPSMEASTETSTSQSVKIESSLKNEEAPSIAKPSDPTYTQVEENVTSEWSSMENQSIVPNSDPIRTKENGMETHELPPKVPRAKTGDGNHRKKAMQMEGSRSIAENDQQPTTNLQSSTYFAPRPFKRSTPTTSRRESSKLESRLDYESIIGISIKQNPELKITSPSRGQQGRTSPCAATQARLQGGTGSGAPQSHQTGLVGANGSSMGSSGGGSRKPPSSYPPFTTRRSSSNNSCLSKKLEGLSGSRGTTNSKNSSSNISTSSANPARKCREHEERKCPRNRNNRRKCEKERPKCKKESKKICKRYCCPALQTPTDCDYSRFQCPKDKCKNNVKRNERRIDPTCLPPEEDAQEHGREFCTKPQRRRDDCNQSCKRERKCNRERYGRSCDRQLRRRSCQREERRDCSQSEQGGREICTKPRRRDTCKRQRKCEDRDCGRRSAKCTGRRNYTQSACANPAKSTRTIKRCSSLPAFAVPLIGVRSNGETKQNWFGSPSVDRFYGKKAKSSSSCKDSKSDTSCKRPPTKCQTKKSSCDTKKEDPCKTVRGTCGAKKEDPCKKVHSSCDTKKEDPCKKLRASCDTKKKEDPCKKVHSSCDTKKEDPCKKLRASCDTKKKEDPCKKVHSSCDTKKEDPCKKLRASCDTKKKEDPCKKVHSSCDTKQEDPCKKLRASCDTKKKEDPCKKVHSSCDTKKEDPCKKLRASCDTKKKEDPCKKVHSSCDTKKEDPCKKLRASCDTKKKEDPCKKVHSSCDTKKKEDPCKKVSTTSCAAPPKKVDPCKTASKTSCSHTPRKQDPCKTEDNCTKKREQICQDRKKMCSAQSSQSESVKERAERERKEMEECKKGINDIKKKKKKEEKEATPGLERVISPCKQMTNKDSSTCKKFANIDVPFFMNTVSSASVWQDGNKLLSVPSDRLYSTAKITNSDGELGLRTNFWNLNDNDNFDFDEIPSVVVVDNEDEALQDNFESSWFHSWFNSHDGPSLKMKKW
ncbi:uncharacterized protein LOC143433596 [Xylocopa sonorina]|uniref:uncharacterized protein LOC143433596 n=1 Tax=Xylocopa sonorina TaxID=1818115 RepID=UPI00403AF35B